jgi:hypothetical protein
MYRIRSKITGNEGVIVGSSRIALVAFDNGEHVMIDADEIEALPEPIPPALGAKKFARDDDVICVHPFWSTGLTAMVVHQDGGKLWVVWHRHHWKYAGQIDGQYSTESFDHYHESVVGEAA